MSKLTQNTVTTLAQPKAAPQVRAMSKLSTGKSPTAVPGTGARSPLPDRLPEFQALGRRVRDQFGVARTQAKENLARMAARAGGGPQGFLAKQQRLSDQGLAQAEQAQMSDIGFQEAATRRAEQEQRHQFDRQHELAQREQKRAEVETAFNAFQEILKNKFRNPQEFMVGLNHIATAFENWLGGGSTINMLTGENPVFSQPVKNIASKHPTVAVPSVTPQNAFHIAQNISSTGQGLQHTRDGVFYQGRRLSPQEVNLIELQLRNFA